MSKPSPRKRNRPGSRTESAKAQARNKSAAVVAKVVREPASAPALCIVGELDHRFWGMSLRERLKRQFARAGVKHVIGTEEAMALNGPVVFVASDSVLDQPLIEILCKRPNLVLLPDDEGNSVPVAINMNGIRSGKAISLLNGVSDKADGGPESALLHRRPVELNAAFWKGLRKREVPYARRVTADGRGDLEWRMFMGTYKGATDFVTKHFWPRPAFYVTRWLAGTRISPNMVTTLGAILMVLAFWLFLEGYFILGLCAAWMMTFLDTVDGKLARTTLTSSKWGDIFDHGIDLVHPPFWYVAWALGLAKTGLGLAPATFWWVISIILGGYVLQRIVEGIAIKWLGMEIHIWRPVDTWFRQITARRNPNLALLTVAVLAGHPDWGLLAVAIWTLVCLILHGIQLTHAFLHRARHGELTSWMNARRPGK